MSGGVPSLILLGQISYGAFLIARAAGRYILLTASYSISK